MRRTELRITDDEALLRFLPKAGTTAQPNPPYHQWIRILRAYLRMTQVELAARAGIRQSHVERIESGKTDVRLSTLKKIFAALSCDLAIEPAPRKPLEDTLRGRARMVALKRLKQSMGTMALEDQAPDADLFRRLLEKKTDEILADRREKLWRESDD